MYWDGELDVEQDQIGNSASAWSDNVPRTKSGLTWLSNSPDSYVNAQNQEAAWLREDMIRREGYKREDEAYDRLFSQLKGLGVNPALLLSSVGPTVGSANSNSAESFKTSNFAANARTQEANSAKVAGSIIAALALVAGAIIAAV